MSFSDRFGYRPTPEPDAELIREDAPDGVRIGALQIFEEVLEIGEIRVVVCGALHKRPDPQNHGEKYVRHEVEELVHDADWPKFYDIVEAVLKSINRSRRENAERQLNTLFAEEHLAWHIVDSKVVLCTGDVSDAIASHAIDGLGQLGRTTARSELRKAIAALSKRPQPDTRDAVRFAAGAMEAVARDITGDRSATLGEILKRKGKALLAPPLPKAFEMVWGYCSETARHVDEQTSPTLDEAILVVGLVAAAVSYLARQ
jgi:hypothetical protein